MMKLVQLLKFSPSDEVQPYCTQIGCVCPRGYQMIEYAFKSVCRVEETTDDPDQQPSKITQHTET